jgi:predicted transcriptional regulator YdeE
MSDAVEIVKLDQKKLIGIPVTSVFEGHGPRRIEEAKQIFLNRRHEIKNAVNNQEYVCPSFASEAVFTYFFCMEVSEIDEVPDGMLGFTIPAHSYGKTRSDQDPYEAIHAYLRANGMESNMKALALEVYSFDEPQWPSKVDVFVPIKE